MAKYNVQFAGTSIGRSKEIIEADTYEIDDGWVTFYKVASRSASGHRKDPVASYKEHDVLEVKRIEE